MGSDLSAGSFAFSPCSTQREVTAVLVGYHDHAWGGPRFGPGSPGYARGHEQRSSVGHRIGSGQNFPQKNFKKSLELAPKSFANF